MPYTESTVMMHFHFFLSSARAAPSSRSSSLLATSWLITSCQQYLGLPQGLFQLISAGLNFSIEELGSQVGSAAGVHTISGGSSLPGGWLGLGVFLLWPPHLWHAPAMRFPQWFTGTASWGSLFALQWTSSLVTSQKHRRRWRVWTPYRLKSFGSWHLDVSTMAAREISWMQWLNSSSCALLSVDCILAQVV